MIITYMTELHLGTLNHQQRDMRGHQHCGTPLTQTGAPVTSTSLDGCWCETT